MLEAVCNLSEEVKQIWSVIEKIKGSVLEGNKTIAEIKKVIETQMIKSNIREDSVNQTPEKADKQTQASEHDSLILYRQKAEKLASELRTALKETIELRGQLYNKELEQQSQLAERTEKLVALLSRNEILEEQNSGLRVQLQEIEEKYRSATQSLELTRSEHQIDSSIILCYIINNTIDNINF